MKAFGFRLKQERTRLGLTQAALARIGGVATNAQGHYESGWRRPKADYLQKLGTAGVDLTFLLTIQSPEFVENQPRKTNTDSNTIQCSYKVADACRCNAIDDLFELLRLNLQTSAKAISEAAHILNPGVDQASDRALQNQLDQLIADSINLVNAAFSKAAADSRDQ
jgi:transcriptional regulator with XRE-family HTH domain